MSNKSISFKLKVCTLSIIIVIALIISYSSLLIYKKNTFYPTANKGRMLTNSIKLNIE